MTDRLMMFFNSDNVRPSLRGVVNQYRALATHLCIAAPPSPERTLALRGLVSSLDDAVRALSLYYTEIGWPDQPALPLEGETYPQAPQEVRE